MLLSLNDNISPNIALNDFKFIYVVDLEQSFSTNLISDGPNFRRKSPLFGKIPTLLPKKSYADGYLHRRPSYGRSRKMV